MKVSVACNICTVVFVFVLGFTVEFEFVVVFVEGFVTTVEFGTYVLLEDVLLSYLPS